MVQYVEGFQPKRCRQALVDWEVTGDLSVKLVVGGAAEGVSADISQSPISRAGQRIGLFGRWIDWASVGALSKGGRVQVTPVGCAAA